VSLLLAISELYVPRFVRKREFERLFKATAGAFQVPTPSTRGLAFPDCLRLYAAFTREQAEKRIRQGNTEALRERLFQNASRLGATYRARLGLRTESDVMRMARFIYKLLRIDFHGAPQGEVLIRRCFFSDYYSVQVCRLISSLDCGLLSGLSGGGILRFSERITGGHNCCLAHFDMATP